VVSFVVLALHTLYLIVLAGGLLDPRGQMVVALLAYAAYVVNAAQFLVKLRSARQATASQVAEPEPTHEGTVL
jgi:3-vinyl bacteriochlorophyllide hydratase